MVDPDAMVACPYRSGYSPVMFKTLEAVIGKDNVIRLLEPVNLAGVRRALVTILDEEPLALASEAALADWNRPEEDAAWAHLSEGRP